jgi:hypothetical protein
VVVGGEEQEEEEEEGIMLRCGGPGGVGASA